MEKKSYPDPASPSDNAVEAGTTGTKNSRSRKKHYSVEDGLCPLWIKPSYGLRLKVGFALLRRDE